MKSEGVRDIIRMLEARCKLLKTEIEHEKANRDPWSGDYYLDKLQGAFDECVAIKISTEKYMKKLQHQGE